MDSLLSVKGGGSDRIPWEESKGDYQDTSNRRNGKLETLYIKEWR